MWLKWKKNLGVVKHFVKSSKLCLCYKKLHCPIKNYLGYENLPQLVVNFPEPGKIKILSCKLPFFWPKRVGWTQSHSYQRYKKLPFAIKKFCESNENVFYANHKPPWARKKIPFLEWAVKSFFRLKRVGLDQRQVFQIYQKNFLCYKICLRP